MAAGAGDDVGRKAWADTRVLPDLDWKRHVVEGRHRLLLSKDCQAVAQHLRQRPKEHLRDAPLRRGKRRIDDAPPLPGLFSCCDEAREIMLLRGGVAEASLNVGVSCFAKSPPI